MIDGWLGFVKGDSCILYGSSGSGNAVFRMFFIGMEEKFSVFVWYHRWNFVIFAIGLRNQSKDILLNSFTITTVSKRATTNIGTAPIRAQTSHIWLWFVVNREAYGECLRFFCNQKHKEYDTNEP